MSTTENASPKSEWYAWTEIATGADVDKDSKTIMNRKFIPVGSVVKPSDLPGGQKEFDHFKEIGVIRDNPMPQTRLDQSPKQAVIAEAKAQVDAITRNARKGTSKQR